MILRADSRTIPLRDGCVQMVCTSPPYWGLRSYGIGAENGEIGLESTPDEYVATMVAVFREVWRVLRPDGTVWLNLGDSFAHNGACGGGSPVDARKPEYGRKGYESDHFGGRDEAKSAQVKARVPLGLKPKDLCGIPWLVAKALQAPYYIGKIKREADRAWLAGWLDGEGTISFVERDRGEGRTPTHDCRVFFTNCDTTPMEEFAPISGGRIYQHDGERENRYGSRPCYRWQMGTHDGALLLRELYPHLRTKRKQAILIWTLFTTLRHQNGHASTPIDVIQQRRAIADMVRALNRGEAVDLPNWVIEPPSPTEPGWYLRSDIIWSKLNPMPESVTDRPTRSHEYIFLLTKSERYFYDADAIREAHAVPEHAPGNKFHPDKISGPNNRNGHSQWEGDQTRTWFNAAGRNKRDVWTVNSEPTPEAHFAVFPQKLIEPCILAGTSEKGCCAECGAPRVRLTETSGEWRAQHNRPAKHNGAVYRTNPGGGLRGPNTPRESVATGWRPSCDHDAPSVPCLVLDPFGGSGTVGKVCERLGRRWAIIELSADYIAIAKRRTAQQGLFGHANQAVEVR